MDMIRSFLPVGQGAFYAEQFKSNETKINVIYDCGSSTGVEIVNKMIASAFSRGEKIYAVFISHMHYDHINGLEFLLKYCNVENLYLPYLTPDNVTISFIVQEMATCKKSEFVKDFVLNPENAVEDFCKENNCSRPRIRFVVSNEDRKARIMDIEQKGNQYHFSGDSISLPQMRYIKGWEEWRYIPYNYENEGRKKEFLSELHKLNLDMSNQDEIRKQLRTKRGRELIKKAYEHVSGNLNTNTMVVFSGLDPETKMWSWQEILPNPFVMRCCYDCGSSISSGCLYMGDFDARSEKNYQSLVDSYKNVWGQIGIIQLPHHGSESNFNVDLLTKSAFFVISAGYKNKYRHPHVKVLKELILHKRLFAWITEDVGSIMQSLITIKCH